MYPGTRRHGKSPRSAKPMLTAGFRCAPDTLPMNRMIANTISPGATTAAVRLIVSGNAWPIIPPPAATSTRKKVPEQLGEQPAPSECSDPGTPGMGGAGRPRARRQPGPNAPDPLGLRRIPLHTGDYAPARRTPANRAAPSAGSLRCQNSRSVLRSRGSRGTGGDLWRCLSRITASSATCTPRRWSARTDRSTGSACRGSTRPRASRRCSGPSTTASGRSRPPGR